MGIFIECFGSIPNFYKSQKIWIVTLAPVSKTNVPETSFSVTSTSIPLDEDCFNLIGSSKEIEQRPDPINSSSATFTELDFWVLIFNSRSTPKASQ